MNVFLAISIPCWLIPLLVGVISAILGYLLGRFLGGGNNDVEIDVYKNRISKLETDLAACRSSKEVKSRTSGAGNTVTSLAVATSKSKKETAFDAAAAKAVFGKKIKENDLTVVEGIGPKIQELFHNHDVKTWAALANCSVEKCQDVLKSGGKRFEMHKPGTWPEQADLAAKGLWQKLKDWQDRLDGGK
ncbi:hypothetical protein [Olleya aquimaris]|uniref:LSU ribosomal protein L21p n=1 Tax=Olleya aquimaris TaxID=639310 RepID=A0A327R9C2_9FLAO|nr:hypothetical protein [Olleya aquimaris]RAJ12083.1 hypothetical protein LY08_02335 [Olleya aquimaris]